jgi:hypothetical protein
MDLLATFKFHFQFFRVEDLVFISIKNERGVTVTSVNRLYSCYFLMKKLFLDPVWCSFILFAFLLNLRIFVLGLQWISVLVASRHPDAWFSNIFPARGQFSSSFLPIRFWLSRFLLVCPCSLVCALVFRSLPLAHSRVNSVWLWIDSAARAGSLRFPSALAWASASRPALYFPFRVMLFRE